MTATDKRTRRNVFLPDSVWEHASTGRVASAYVRETLEHRLHEVKDARCALHDAGLSFNEAQALIEAAPAHVPHGVPASNLVSEAVEGAAETADRWGITPERWTQLVRLAAREAVARALLVLAADNHAGR